MKKADQIAFLFNKIYEDLCKLCPVDGREFKIVAHELEVACFYAKKSIALLPKNQLNTTPAKK